MKTVKDKDLPSLAINHLVTHHFVWYSYGNALNHEHLIFTPPLHFAH